MRAGRNPDEWSFEQRVAVVTETDHQLVEVLERAKRLSGQLYEELSVAEYLLDRRMRLQREGGEIPF